MKDGDKLKCCGKSEALIKWNERGWSSTFGGFFTGYGIQVDTYDKVYDGEYEPQYEPISFCPFCGKEVGK